MDPAAGLLSCLRGGSPPTGLALGLRFYLRGDCPLEDPPSCLVLLSKPLSLLGSASVASAAARPNTEAEPVAEAAATAIVAEVVGSTIAAEAGRHQPNVRGSRSVPYLGCLHLPSAFPRGLGRRVESSCSFAPKLRSLPSAAARKHPNEGSVKFEQS